jgi:bifunctional ADP-heptose synthase (sugar kinase/adenylyltransferase)
VFDLIESVRDLSVLFVGDTIVDEYQYVRPLGKSPKENLIPALALEREVFVGGTHAAANHARSFCKRVQVCCGDMQIRKVRMVDKNYLRKLYEVHYPVPAEPSPALTDADVTVVTDFGHGFVTRDMITELCDRPFVAVNAQTNAANIGFNLITKYPRADYIVVDEPEARLAAADTESPIEAVIDKLAHGRCDKFVVTHGRHGAYGYDRGRHFHCKAFTDRVVDTMGAGDAFFAVTATMAKEGGMDDLLMIGNAAGALKTQIVGHRSSVTKENLLEYLQEHGTRQSHSSR